MDPEMITEADIRNRVGAQSFSRGEQYFKDGAIVDPREEENTLKAKCWGSAPHPYRLWVQLGPHGIVTGDCSCPVGGGGYCKHVAALLLTWLHNPEQFREQKPLEQALEEREKADLILLIRHMIARYPDLEDLIYLYPTGGAAPGKPVDPDVIRHQVKQAFRYDSYDAPYEITAAVASELEVILQQAEPYLERGDWLGVADIYRITLDELLGRYQDFWDDNSELSGFFWDGSQRLGTCLDELEVPEARLAVLKTLVNIVLEDINVGGYGFADLAYEVILTQATPAEREEIVTWVEEEMSGIGSSDEYSSSWQAQAYGALLIELQADSLSDEEYIQLCRDTGRLSDLVDRLLHLGRVDEAVDAAQTASDYELIALADRFKAHDLNAIAEELVSTRAAQSKDTRLHAWLMQQAIQREDWHSAIEHAEHRFWGRHSIEHYKEMKAIGEKLGDWPERQVTVLSQLNRRKRYELIVRIHLLEGDVNAALATLPNVVYGRMLRIEVAEAAEKTHPRQALAIYQNAAERLIAARGRGNYAEAATYLLRVKAIYRELDEVDVWERYIKAVRNQKPTLPAMLDEFRKAGV